MSIQSAQDSIRQFETGADYRKQLEAAADDVARRRIIQAAGCEFTREEFHQAAKELDAASERELSPEELQGIAAGAGPGHWCVTQCPKFYCSALGD